MDKKVIFLTDLETGSTDAVIFATTSTANDVSQAILKMKEQKGWDYQWEDIQKCLPKDCVMYDAWHAERAIY